MTRWDELNAYFAERYELAIGFNLKPGRKIFLGNKRNRKCRFCGRSSPGVTFRKEAHALPEFVGNKSLFTYYECDSCNHAFGSGFENDFGNWSLPMRTLSRIHGKSGIPTIKQGPNNTWRIDGHPDGLNISSDDPEAFIEDDPSTRTLKLHLFRGAYRPIGVVQTLVKIALSIMPEEKLPNFQKALDWIRPSNPLTRLVAPTPFLHTFLSGPVANDLITVAVCTRLRDDLVTPYAFLLLMYGHEMLQLVIPSLEKDQHHYGKPMEFRRFPCFRDEGGLAPGPIETRSLPFDSPDIISGESLIFNIQYQEKVPR